MRFVCFEMTHRAGRQGGVGCSRSEFSRVLGDHDQIQIGANGGGLHGRVHHMCTFIWYEHNSGIGGSKEEQRQHKARDNNQEPDDAGPKNINEGWKGSTKRGSNPWIS